MANKYQEDNEDAKIRLFLEHGRRIMDSFNEGDYLTISRFDDENYEDDEHAPVTDDLINLDMVISSKRSAALNDMYFEDDEEEKELNLKIVRLWKVVRIAEGGIPIIKRVKFPNEHVADGDEFSLLQAFYMFLDDFFGNVYEVPDIKIIDNFAKLDGNYADSIILESEYIPYMQDVRKLKDVEARLDVIYKQIQKERAARIRKEKREEDQMWKGEFLRVVGFGLRKKYGE
ncbi:hypothetical protein UFOVP53_89 [uncultured Caudovirales phage]|uniref:Uncharacterized protein n=1 Tax=uncultured Caudovirales phage TaxID=2100421 RepID=A0A6J5KWH8_9CAUD|nr:hypothetical protein UFOVP53_89 [uncultured Caudovirales phage]